MSELGLCELCKKHTQQKCGSCHNIFYCCKEHQRLDWKNHKKICRPFKICNDEILGRYLIATRQIQEGSIILDESPLISGPLQITLPVCLGCGNSVTSNTVHPCTKCGWPLCSKICENNPNHIPECYYTCQKGENISITTYDFVHPLYQCITVLRCLYQKLTAPDVWKKLINLESHCNKRKDTEKYKSDQICVGNVIRKFFKLENDFLEEEILKVCGIIMINGHDVPLSTPPHVAIFYQTSLIEHSCKANCYKTFSPEGHIKIIAGIPIEEGDHLSISYVDPLWSTPSRLKFLTNAKFFSCNCLRCTDVTEFQTYCSGLKCQNGNCNGNMLPENFFVSNLAWKCNMCINSIARPLIEETLNSIGENLIAIKKGNSEACKSFIQQYTNTLPTNHSYLLDVKLALVQILGNASKKALRQLPHEDLKLKYTLSLSILEVLKVLAPAEKRLSGILFTEMYVAIEEMKRRKVKLVEQNLFSSTDILSKIIECLKHEPLTTYEGKQYQKAENILKTTKFRKK